MGACFVWTAVAAMVGSRLLYVITNPDQFSGGNLGDIVNVRKGGLVAYGGFIGGFLGSWLYLRRERIRLLAWADVAVTTLASGLGITRIGCFCYGCCYGKPIPEDAPGWIAAIGVRFPNWDVKFADFVARSRESASCAMSEISGAPAFNHHVSEGLVPAGAAESLAVYPTQLIEIANGWILFGLLMIVRRYRRFRGQMFLFFTAYYGVTRTLVEMIRGDTQRGGIGDVSTSQIVGVATFLASIAAWIVLSRRAAADPEAAMDLGPGAVPASSVSQPQRGKKKRRKKRK